MVGMTQLCIPGRGKKTERPHYCESSQKVPGLLHCPACETLCSTLHGVKIRPGARGCLINSTAELYRKSYAHSLYIDIYLKRLDYAGTWCETGLEDSWQCRVQPHDGWPYFEVNLGLVQACKVFRLLDRHLLEAPKQV